MMAGVKGDIDLASNARAKKAETWSRSKNMISVLSLELGFNFFFPKLYLSPEIKISNGLNNIHSRDEHLNSPMYLTRYNRE